MAYESAAYQQQQVQSQTERVSAIQTSSAVRGLLIASTNSAPMIRLPVPRVTANFIDMGFMSQIYGHLFTVWDYFCHNAGNLRPDKHFRWDESLKRVPDCEFVATMWDSRTNFTPTRVRISATCGERFTTVKQRPASRALT